MKLSFRQTPHVPDFRDCAVGLHRCDSSQKSAEVAVAYKCLTIVETVACFVISYPVEQISHKNVHN